jgi:nicotinamidase-related amidase
MIFLGMTNTALLVVDAQESFRQRPYWTDADYQPFRDRLQTLIDGCAARGVPVVQVFHVEKEGAFSLASGHVRKLEEIAIKPDLVIHKHMHSALAGTELAGWLTERGLRRLIVTGIRTEQCCETTTRHASDSGYTVHYVTEATLTFPMVHPRTGRHVMPDEIRDRTELVLGDRFARIMTADQALNDL